MKTKIFFCIDEIADKLIELIPEHFPHFKENRIKLEYFRYMYVLHLVLSNRSFNPNKYNKDGVALNNSDKAKALKCKTGEFSVLIHNLISWGFLEKGLKYKVGEWSQHYRLAGEWENRPISRRTITAGEATFLHDIIKSEEDKTSKDRILKYQLRMLNRVTITEEGIKYLKRVCKSSRDVIAMYPNLPEDVEIKAIKKKDSNLISILLKDWYVTRPVKDSRIYSNLTNLKRTHRKYLLFDGKPMYATDISCSQILLSVPLLRKQISILNAKGSDYHEFGLFRYYMAAKSGKFYEDLAEKAGFYFPVDGKEGKGKSINRNTFKKKFFKAIYFSKIGAGSVSIFPKHKLNPTEIIKILRASLSYGCKYPEKDSIYSKIREAFERKYPTVYELINEMKAENHADFATALQKDEAMLMIDEVYKQLVAKKIKALTLHDAIYVTNNDDLLTAEKLIADYLLKKGVRVDFKHEA